jgi:hypothetical protein
MSGVQQEVLECLRGELEQMIPRVRQVIAQTKARIFRGETRTEGKIFSLFEPTLEAIVLAAVKDETFGWRCAPTLHPAHQYGDGLVELSLLAVSTADPATVP